MLEKKQAVTGEPMPSAIILRPEFQKALTLQRRGIHDLSSSNGVSLLPNFSDSYLQLWSIQIFLLHRLHQSNTRPIHLPATVLSTPKEACAYFTKYINNRAVLVTYPPDKLRAQLQLKDDGINLRFSKDVRDIFVNPFQYHVTYE